MKENKDLVEGIYRANSKGFGFVQIEDKKEDIFIPNQFKKDAMEKDKVLIKIVSDKKDNMHKEGRVIKVIKHEIDTVVGTFQKSKNFAFVVPDNSKIGSDIFIPKSAFGKAKNKQKVVVKITKYPTAKKKAEGKVIEVIGYVDEAGVDMMSLIYEYGLLYEFPKAVISQAKAIPQKIDESQIKNRLDLRKKEIFTIDGEDAKDLDDAVCVDKNEDGSFTLGVHIADVSNYVKEGSMLDREAILRGTSIYMMDRVIPMLPKELSNGICSLNENVDRFTLSVIMKIDEKGNVIDSQICKSVINVTKRMSYKDVFAILKGKDEKILKKYEPYISHFQTMNELSLILKKKRQNKGYLDLDIPESKITLNEAGVAVDVKKYETNIANEIIEQFMLTANETVAEQFYFLEAPFIYRVHEIPDEDKIRELNKFLYNFGYKIKGKKENISPKEFSKILEEVKGKEEEKVVSTLILRTLKIARYEEINKGHFGIASKYYCHFTSPIRRYPDLFIHRIISKYLENSYQMSDEEKQIYEKRACEIAQSSSDCEKVAQKVERDSEDIKKAEYMQDKIGCIYDGIISSVTKFGVFVELDNTVEGLIRFEDLGNDYYEYDEDRKRLIGQNTKEVYKIGDKIKIEVISADKKTRMIDFKKVS